MGYRKIFGWNKRVGSSLKKAGYKIAFLSNNWEGMTDKMLEMIPEFGIVDMLFESSKEGYRKPEPEFYQLVEQKTGVRGKDIYFIDDVQEYIEQAQKHDWQTLLYILGNDKGESSNKKIRENLL